MRPGPPPPLDVPTSDASRHPLFPTRPVAVAHMVTDVDDHEADPEFCPSPGRPLPAVRCRFLKRSGERCKNRALLGTTVCLAHGGRLNGVKAAAQSRVEEARQRLLGMPERAVEKIQELMEGAESENVQLRAAETILNRTGIVEVKRTETEHKLSGQSLDDAIERLLVRHARRAQGEGDVIEAQVKEVGPGGES